MKSNRGIDVGVITSLAISPDDLLGLLAEDRKFLKIDYEDKYYKIVMHTSSNEEMTIVITFDSDRLGGIATAISTSKMILNWKPRFLIHLGLARAFAQSERKIGDVIVPSNVKNCYYRSFNDIRILSELNSYCVDDIVRDFLFRLRDNFKLVASFDDGEEIGSKDRSAIPNRTFKEGRESALQVPTEYMLSDGSLDISRPLNENDVYEINCCGVIDVQASNVIEVCLHEDTPISWIIIRGISSIGSQGEITRNRIAASRNSCVVLRDILVNYLPSSLLGEIVDGQVAIDRRTYEYIDKITELFDEEKWEAACTIAKTISRSLWLSAEYDIRISLGKAVDSCKGKFKNAEYYRMSALIDDIGWTLYVSEHSIIDAKDYISDGLAIAEGLGDYYYVAKGYRHLASIERSLGNLNIAKQWLVFADYYADWIENDSSKREMKASLMLSRAKLHGLNNVASEKEVAIEIAEEVAEEYVELSCPDRAVKSYRFIGEMYEALGQHERAMDYFSRGRREAKKVDRIDELEMNAMKISSQLSRYLEDSRA